MISPTEFIMSIGSESILFAHKADLLLKKEQIEEALELCEEGVKRFPFYAEGYVQLARSYQMLEKNEQAIEAYKKALFYQPGHSKALKGLAYLYYKLRDKERGEQTLLSAYLYDPFDSELHDFLQSEALLAKIYAPPVFEEDQEEETSEEEKVTLDVEQILDDTRLTPEDERNHIIEEIDEHPTKKQDESIDHYLFPEINEEASDNKLPEEDESGLDFADGITQEDIEADFFPDDISEITPGVGEIPSRPPQEDVTDEKEKEESLDQEIDSAKGKNLNGDEFSAWMMNDLFQSDDTSLKEEQEEKKKEDVPPPKPENDLFEDEHPVLDTALIFAENRNTESETDDEEKDKGNRVIDSDEKPVADFNTLEEDIERISSENAAAIENIMTEPKSETSEELDEVIKRIQESTEKRKDDSSLKQLEFDRKQAKAVEEESVDIEDILNNPSLLTPTFGEILIAQHKFEDALKVFTALSQKEPDNPRFRKKIDFLTKLVSARK